MLDYLRRQGSTALRLLVLGAGTMISISCGDDPVTLNTDGTIQVAAITEGTDFDVDGYGVAVNGGQTIPIGNLDTIWVTAVQPGTYQVSLAGLAENCSTATGTNPKSVEVVPVDTVKAEFTITCDVPTPPGGGGGGDLTRAFR